MPKGFKKFAQSPINRPIWSHCWWQIFFLSWLSRPMNLVRTYFQNIFTSNKHLRGNSIIFFFKHKWNQVLLSLSSNPKCGRLPSLKVFTLFEQPILLIFLTNWQNANMWDKKDLLFEFSLFKNCDKLLKPTKQSQVTLKDNGLV